MSAERGMENAIDQLRTMLRGGTPAAIAYGGPGRIVALAMADLKPAEQARFNTLFFDVLRRRERDRQRGKKSR